MKQMKPFAGKWRIVEMEVWDQDYVDMEVPGYFRIGSDGIGQFQFRLVFGCAENFPHHIGLPRGCLDAVFDLLQENDIRLELQDERLPGRKVSAKFTGTLRKDQKAAVRETLKPKFQLETAFFRV
jgi:hypothetical protein